MISINILLRPKNDRFPSAITSIKNSDSSICPHQTTEHKEGEHQNETVIVVICVSDEERKTLNFNPLKRTC